MGLTLSPGAKTRGCDSWLFTTNIVNRLSNTHGCDMKSLNGYLETHGCDSSSDPWVWQLTACKNCQTHGVQQSQFYAQHPLGVTGRRLTVRPMGFSIANFTHNTLWVWREGTSLSDHDTDEIDSVTTYNTPGGVTSTWRDRVWQEGAERSDPRGVA